jgi:hypothetical protein
VRLSRYCRCLRDASLPPFDLLQPAQRILDQDRFGSCRPSPLVLCSASIGSVLPYTGPARLSLLHQLDDFSFGPESRGHANPLELPCAGRRVLKKIIRSSVFELLGPTFFLRPEAVLRREAGAGAHGTRADPGPVLSR